MTKRIILLVLITHCWTRTHRKHNHLNSRQIEANSTVVTKTPHDDLGFYKIKKVRFDRATYINFEWKLFHKYSTLNILYWCILHVRLNFFIFWIPNLRFS